LSFLDLNLKKHDFLRTIKKGQGKDKERTRKGQGKDKERTERTERTRKDVKMTRKDEKRTIKDEKKKGHQLEIFWSFCPSQTKIQKTPFLTDYHKGREKDKKGPKKDKKGPKKDKKGPKKDKGFIFVDFSLKEQKGQERTKTPRIPPWVFIPVRNILVFFYFSKANQ
jgi:hypothetical protein